MNNIERHQEDLKLSAKDEPLSVWAILMQLKSPKSKAKLPSDLSAKMLESVLKGRNYPEYLLQTVVRRTKTDKDEEEKKFYSVNRIRIRIIKACLLRMKYYKGEEFMLESKTHDKAFQCGRLFAVLEKIQTDAFKDDEKSKVSINASIKDKFFASACSTPYLVFPRLLKLAQPHLKKITKRRASDGEKICTYYDKLLQEIISQIDEFPKALSLPRQGDFLLGYYQQKQKFYENKNQKGENEV
jgi:CRISPR-associated protein Csd1